MELELQALKSFRYGRPRRQLKRGDTFRAASRKDAKVLTALRLAVTADTYETTAIQGAPVVKRRR